MVVACRGWTLALAILLLAPVAGRAQGPASAPPPTPAAGRVVQLEYAFTVSGLDAFRAGATLRLDGERYVVDASFNKLGIVAALTSTFNGRNRAWGTSGPQGLQPQGGWSWIQFGDSVRTWQVGYRGDGTYGEEHIPPFTPDPTRPVSAEHKRGAFDPLTAALLGALSGGEPCERVYPVFDSKRRFDVALRRIGTEMLGAREIPQVRGEALVCEAVMKRIAGYASDRLKPDAYERRPPRLWFAPLDGYERPIPVKMEMATSFGTVLGKLKSYKVRTMTAEDRRATAPH